MPEHCYVIAEIGSNHDGDYSQALELINEAARVGADAVKFQCIPPFEPNWMPTLMLYAGARGLECSASVFDPAAVQELDELEVPWFKVASTELVYDELLEAIALTRRRVFLSTGMANFEEIARALRILRPCWVTLMQCTVLYPTPPEQVNLRAIDRLWARFNLPVGFSDHSQSVAIPAAATALGAVAIEKHLTLGRERSRDPDGPDHQFALRPFEFEVMVANVREVGQALGDGKKDGPVDGEPIGIRGRRLKWR